MQLFKKYLSKIVKSVKVELYVFLFIFAMAIKSVTIVQMYQDKLCAIDGGYRASFCKHLNASDELEQQIKAEVLGKSSLFLIYQSLITTIPVTVVSLFIGPWVDKHFKALKILFMTTAIGSSLETIILMLNAFYFKWICTQTLFVMKGSQMMFLSFIPTAVSGSAIHVAMAAFSYVPKTTSEKYRPIRFALLEFSIFIASPLGAYIGGVIIKVPTFKTKDDLQNYMGVFMTALFVQFILLLWTIFVIDSNNYFTEDKHNDKDVPRVNGNVEVANNQVTIETYWCVLKDLFDVQNVKQAFRTCFKRRPNGERKQLWLLFASLYIIVIMMIGDVAVMFQFTEKVFSWDASTYSTINAIGSIYSSFASVITVYVLLKKIKMNDISLALLGTLSFFVSNVLRGSILKPFGYYAALVFGCLGGLSSIGIRSYLSRLVAREELAQVFCLLASLEATVQLVASVVTASFFKVTVANYPGLVFQLLALINFFPLIALMYIDICYVQKRKEIILIMNSENEIIQIYTRTFLSREN
ncbi:hypothetical protein B4U79_17886 [Dinothrombium tinctorium]|uniref:Uncharacterized protein n=1 Tax=Dinothrombium tinctorium TaxID=1965070 RepID=A0A3S3PNG3_9ACAR|nr:hypothetical protein B4U79_17886 [Dinothrombium tinctorium]